MKKLIYRAVLIAAAVFCICACEQEPEETAETEEPFVAAPKDPPKNAIPIASAEDLAKIGKDKDFPLNGAYKLEGDITTAGWTPIGGTLNFTGAFYGMNNKITITSGSGGIFASLRRATIYNLKVSIKADADAGSIGGIANFAENSLIDGCEAAVILNLAASIHNASAGGIVGYMKNNVTVSGCTASGAITLTSGMNAGLMVYAGGVVGYSGSGAQGTASKNPTRITRSSWNGTVSASGGYPYVGGVVGYNYTGAKVTRCSSQGAVTATGGNLPYAGGVAGYNSGGDIAKPTVDTEAVTENCYSTATVNAVSSSKVALAGGIAGSNACRARISKCYATGAVTATVNGNSADDIGGSLGVMVAASAGGIAGAQYYKGPLVIEYCAALNTSITGTDSASGAVWNIYRIAGAGKEGSDIGVFKGNIAYSSMTITPTRSPTVSATGKDGADTGNTPAQTVYAGIGMGWDFATVWQMSGSYPVLR
ncbi:MAG: hypothetical protein LBK66_10020 [Spirochaetaceae bacterium]|jgi:hypothetical protein|nr:hypothetical protein [Spirochaetaceae bacterium]